MSLHLRYELHLNKWNYKLNCETFGGRPYDLYVDKCNSYLQCKFESV